MWIGPLGSFFFLEVFEPDRRTVLPSMATTSAGPPVCAATHATKQRSKASVSSVARMSPRVIVRRGSILEGSEAPEKSQFQPAKSGDVGDCFRPGDHGEQAQQQDLVERIFDLAALPGVRQILEIAKEDDCFAKRPGFISRTLQRN